MSNDKSLNFTIRLQADQAPLSRRRPKVLPAVAFPRTMPIPRFFCPAPLQPDTLIELPVAAAHHALRALRLAAGAAVVLFDGTGGEYPAVLQVSGTRVAARTGPHDPRECELPGELVLIQAMAGGDKMDWIVEKAVELGVCALCPVQAQRSVLHLDGARLEKRLARWRAIVQSACEQCGRNRLMQIRAPASLAHCLAQAAGPILFCHPEGAPDFVAALGTARHTLTLVVGPEGGWSPAELAIAQRQALQPVRFGSRVLRTETAGLAMVAAATAVLGWLDQTSARPE